MDLPLKLICTDFDGTLHHGTETPPVPHELQLLIQHCQQQGMTWLINTGRELNELIKILCQSGLIVQPDYLVVVEREIHYRRGANYLPLLDWNESCQRQQERLFVRIRPRLPEAFQWIHSHYQATLYADSYSPLCLIARNNQDAEDILKYLVRFFQDEPELTFVRNDIYARCSHVAFNKGTAMAEVARHLRIARDQVFAAGDHYNDLPMLSPEYARWIVAPANAIPEVKSEVLRQGGYVSPQSHGRGVMDGLTRLGLSRTPNSALIGTC
jgi:HAD superfamily hydrolase (TIGR01484 family)